MMVLRPSVVGRESAKTFNVNRRRKSVNNSKAYIPLSNNCHNPAFIVFQGAGNPILNNSYTGNASNCFSALHVTPRALHNMPFLFFHWAQRQHATLHLSMTPLPRHASDFTLTLSLLHPMMDMMYRPLLPPTQYCPCNLTPTRLSSLPHSNSPLPFYRALFVPYTPLWVNSTPQKEDNSPSVDPDTHSLQQAGIDYRLAFERKKKTEAKYWDSMASFCSLYIPRGRWHWTHQVTFEDRSEEIRISGTCI